MANVDLTLTTKGDVKIESSYNGKIEVTVDCVDIDEVISELESKGYTVSE